MTDFTRYIRNPVAFIDDLIPRNEKGQLWHLSPYQRRVLALVFVWDDLGRLLFRLFVWSELKKSGKTFMAACLVLWWGFTTAHTEVILVANDLDQSVGRVFKTLVELLEANPALAASAQVLRESVRLSNGTVILAIASDYKGAAGSRHSLYVVDEPWGIMEERAVRLFEELTPPPTEPNAWGLMTTTAGWTGESKLLEGLYRRGVAGEHLDPELEVTRAEELVMFWSHTPRQPWQTAAYYAEQARSLRPATFARLHRNEWVSSESVFLTPDLWDACVDLEHRPWLDAQEPGVSIGVDAGIKSDNASVQVVAREEDWVVHVTGRIWKPTPGDPVDLEATIETYIRELAMRFHVQAIYVDPYQMARSMKTLADAGLPIVEYAQTTGNTTRMGSTLYDLVRYQNLRLYPDPELRQQALHAVAVETARGFRLAKERASRKIDAIVALAMACVACLDQPAYVVPRVW